jgi:heme/copper-type cytochrome/quinol oxidase subunit 2
MFLGFGILGLVFTYFLAKGKTDNLFLVVLLGFIINLFMPVIGLTYCVLWAFKDKRDASEFL